MEASSRELTQVNSKSRNIYSCGVEPEIGVNWRRHCLCEGRSRGISHCPRPLMKIEDGLPWGEDLFKDSRCNVPLTVQASARGPVAGAIYHLHQNRQMPELIYTHSSTHTVCHQSMALYTYTV